MHFDFPAFLVLATLVTGIIWLIDALFLASKRKLKLGAADEYHEPILVEYSKSFFPIIFAVLILRSFLVEPFRIPSGSMMPTLLVGDFILVNKFSYGIRLPAINKKIIDIDTPKRGDVFVFRYPRNPRMDYIKRAVGVPGDVLEYKDKVLYVNGAPQELTKVGVFTGTGSNARDTGSLRIQERLGTVEHEILINNMAPNFGYGCHVLARGPFTVPEGHYFAMGDNRDNSNDSRCWGLVPEANLVGKAFAIWMNWDSNESGFPPISWSRIGSGIK